MRAVVWHGASDVRVERVADAALFDDRSALVRVEASSICGSDLHLYHGLVPVIPGTILGHECIGTVEEVGGAVRRLRPGQRVLVPAVVGCGECSCCRESYVVGCEQLVAKVFGVSPLLPGAQAEMVAVPAADFNLRPIPPEVSDEDALLLTDIGPTGFYAARNADIRPGDSVVVVGCGPVGLCALQSAALFSPAQLIAVDRVCDRLEAARRFATHVLDASALDVAAAVRELTAGRGADAVIEAVGSTETMRLCFELVRIGGTISVVGVLIRDDFPFPMGTALLKDITVRVGLVNVGHFLPRLFGLVRAGRLSLAPLITHRFALEEAPQAYRLFDTRAGGCLKVWLHP